MGAIISAVGFKMRVLRFRDAGVTGKKLAGKNVDFDTYAPASIPRGDMHYNMDDL